MKKCPKCGMLKDTSEFNKNSSSPDGLQGYCKVCQSESARVSNKKHIEHRRLNNSRWRRSSLYGLSEEAFNEMVERSNNLCSICGTEFTKTGKGRMAIDHDHATGKVRGLICHNCNIGLGHFKDSIDALERAIEYLKESK